MSTLTDSKGMLGIQVSASHDIPIPSYPRPALVAHLRVLAMDV